MPSSYRNLCSSCSVFQECFSQGFLESCPMLESATESGVSHLHGYLSWGFSFSIASCCGGPELQLPPPVSLLLSALPHTPQKAGNASREEPEACVSHQHVSLLSRPHPLQFLPVIGHSLVLSKNVCYIFLQILRLLLAESEPVQAAPGLPASLCFTNPCLMLPKT